MAWPVSVFVLERMHTASLFGRICTESSAAFDICHDDRVVRYVRQVFVKTGVSYSPDARLKHLRTGLFMLMMFLVPDQNLNTALLSARDHVNEYLRYLGTIDGNCKKSCSSAKYGPKPATNLDGGRWTQVFCAARVRDVCGVGTLKICLVDVAAYSNE